MVHDSDGVCSPVRDDALSFDRRHNIGARDARLLEFSLTCLAGKHVRVYRHAGG